MYVQVRGSLASLENKFPLLCLRAAAERQRQRQINTDRFNPTAINMFGHQLHQEFMFCSLLFKYVASGY